MRQTWIGTARPAIIMRPQEGRIQSSARRRLLRRLLRQQVSLGGDAGDGIGVTTRRHSTVGYLSAVEFERKVGLA